MYGDHYPTRTRYALLLAALLGSMTMLGFAALSANGLRVLPGYSSGRVSPTSAHFAGSNHPRGSILNAGCTAGDSDIFGKDVVVDSKQWYCGHLTDYGGAITVLGRVSGDVVAVGGAISVSGEVDGRVLALGGSVALLPGAKIGGDVQVVGGSVSRGPGVVVGGQVVNGISGDPFSIPNITSFIPVHLDWADVIFWAFAGLVSALFLPSQLVRVRVMARRQPFGSLLLGLLAYAIGIVAAIVLVLTCLGIPLALAIGVVLWGGSIFGTAALGLWLGSALIPGASYRRLPFVLATVLGVTLLAIASTAPVIGSIIRVLVSTAGLGAVLLTIMTMRHPSPARRRALV